MRRHWRRHRLDYLLFSVAVSRDIYRRAIVGTRIRRLTSEGKMELFEPSGETGRRMSVHRVREDEVPPAPALEEYGMQEVAHRERAWFVPPDAERRAAPPGEDTPWTRVDWKHSAMA
jgi:hypothetical protein